MDISKRAAAAPESGIVSVVNHGRTKPGIIPLWAGEGDLPTPSFISDAAIKALQDGETFYTWQRGIPELRQALANYHSRLFEQKFVPEQFYVTGSGMLAINLAIQATIDAGDEAIYLTPAWPNFPVACGLCDGRPVSVPLQRAQTGWQLDANRLADAITPKTRMLFINTPSNPTGWTATLEELQDILDLARKHGVWIVADEIYTRFFYAAKRAPSFFDIMRPDDRILFVNTFSKNWSMTGWRVGWIAASPELGQDFENLIQYSTSGVPQFLQKGAVAALEHGDEFVEAQKAKALLCRNLFADRLEATGRVKSARPDGAFYAFFEIDGIGDPSKAAIDIIDRANVGLSPGTAFGPGGERFMRACFLRDPAQVAEAADRLANYLRGNTKPSLDQ